MKKCKKSCSPGGAVYGAGFAPERRGSGSFMFSEHRGEKSNKYTDRRHHRQLGWLIHFISHSVISGFTTASAIVIDLSQAKYFLGYEIDRSSKILPLVESIIAGADK
ncbi:hypothetical protein RJT34_29641 [Clitoria ternatea]|uniref:SLC26A/SulP transporter domain-containing protein n=1 Tax=Clitoria ternatea TaxID=43366 RepID=A0AAN9ET83_CLITE